MTTSKCSSCGMEIIWGYNLKTDKRIPVDCNAPILTDSVWIPTLTGEDNHHIGGKQHMNNENSIETIAKVCHEANRAYCQTLGDLSQLLWEMAPEWQRESARNGVRFHLENPDAGPSGSHENWMRVKEADGWVYGETKDPEAKTHPCMVPYDKLPAEQRMKDYIFTAIVRAFQDFAEGG